MNISYAIKTTCALLLAISLSTTSASAYQLKIEVENLGPDTGFFLTPLWFGLHQGDFDLFNPGEASSASLEALAEDGITSGLESDFNAVDGVQGVITGPEGFGSMAPMPPLLDTGETASTIVSMVDPAVSRYFSFASMVIPSNDAFIGNGNPTAYEVFDANGDFNGAITIDVIASEIWDSGTEVNDTLGAAFSTVGGVSSDENGTVQLHSGLNNFLGTGTPAGFNVGVIPSGADPIARITITAVPEPTTIALLAGGLGLALSVRRTH